MSFEGKQSFSEEISHLAISQRIELALAGWEKASAGELDQKAEAIKEVFTNLTCEDLVRNWDYWQTIPKAVGFEERARDYANCAANPKEARDFPTAKLCAQPLIEIRDWLDSQAGEFRLEFERSPMDELVRFFPFLTPFKRAIELRLNQAETPDKQARLLYLLFNVENPFIKSNHQARMIVNSYYQAARREYLLDELPEKVLDWAAWTLGEIVGTVVERRVNAWGYTQEFCQAFLEFMKHPDYGIRFFRDFLNLHSRGKLLLPPQVASLLHQLQIELGGESLEETLVQYYRRNPRLDQGIDQYAQKLNYIVTGQNRALAWPFLPKHIDPRLKDGKLVSLFSGPPATALTRTRLTGLNECVTSGSPGVSGTVL